MYSNDTDLFLNTRVIQMRRINARVIPLVITRTSDRQRWWRRSRLHLNRIEGQTIRILREFFSRK